VIPGQPRIVSNPLYQQKDALPRRLSRLGKVATWWVLLFLWALTMPLGARENHAPADAFDVIGNANGGSVDSTEPEAGPVPEGDVRFTLNGYATTVWLFMQGGGWNSTLNTNRLRLDTETFYRNNWSFRAAVDQEAFTGNLVSMPVWNLINNDQARSYWNLSVGNTYANGFYLRDSLYRLYLQYEARNLRMVAGKQRIAWGVMRFWRPTDFFNPTSPLQVEAGEKTGFDALKVSVPLSNYSDLELVYGPSLVSGQETAVGKFHWVTGEYDCAALAGRVRGSDVWGFTFDGYVGDGGFRGEVVRIQPPGANPFCQWTAGADYTFPNSLTLTAEYLYNGAADGTFINPLSFKPGFLQTRRSHFVSLGANFQITPLVNAGIFASRDTDGNTMVYNPRISWNVEQNTSLNFGYTGFAGDMGGGGEYAGYPNMFFTQATIYF